MKQLNVLLDVIARLRSPGGCPWDIEQTHESCKNGLIEEAYEAVEAIEKKDDELLIEELGDVLLQVAFHSRIAQEQGRFDFGGVCDRITQKLITRHPHVFASDGAELAQVADSADVLDKWDKNKQSEKRQTFTDTLESVPHNLPALMRTQKVQKRAAKSPKYEKNFEQSKQFLTERISTLTTQIIANTNDSTKLAETSGAVIFALCDTLRLAGVDAEGLLRNVTNEFISGAVEA